MDSLARNAFRPGPAVRGVDFFGRQQVLGDIELSLGTGGSVLLVGERRVGKTSVLAQVEFLINQGRLVAPHDFLPIPVNVSGMLFSADDPGRVFATEIVAAIVDWSERSSAPGSRVLQSAADAGADLAALRRWLRRPRDVHLQLAILLDEVDAAILDGPPSTAGVLRELVTQGHVAAIATSYRHPGDYPPGTTYGSVWWNAFRLQYLGAFNDGEAQELLTTLSRRSGREFAQDESAFLMDVFGRMPYYLQVAGWYVFRDGRFLSDNDVRRRVVLLEAAKATYQELRAHFDGVIANLDEDGVGLLRRIVRSSVTELGSDGGDMERRGLVGRDTGGRYHVNCRAFEEYIRELPELSLLQRAGRSLMWDALATLGGKAIEQALGRAVEIAAKRYL